jgi:23S rRNA (adenine1618-N6)-methyltransferase
MFHPRNRHQGQYDLEALKKASPEFVPFVIKTKYGNDSIDFADPKAVLELNRALLKFYYGFQDWTIPSNALCPPIPGRADYIHTLADLLKQAKDVRILDVGVGANGIYPIIGFHEYGWSFVGSDVNPSSLENAQKVASANPQFSKAVEFRLQKNPTQIFKGIIQPEDHFSATMCNPPFHASLEDAQTGSKRKWKNLNKKDAVQKDSVRMNFGGEGAELWCEGGESLFIQRMIQESAGFSSQCDWFTTLVSKEESLPRIVQQLKNAKVRDFRTLEMAQGQKKSRMVAWTFNA